MLVKVNQLIRPVRFYVSRYLHLYLKYEGLQFDKESTMEWNKHFEEASALLDVDKIDKSYESMRITRWTDEITPHVGQWASIVNGTTEYIQTREGHKMPACEDKYGKHHRACWKLLKVMIEVASIHFLSNAMCSIILIEDESLLAPYNDPRIEMIELSAEQHPLAQTVHDFACRFPSTENGDAYLLQGCYDYMRHSNKCSAARRNIN